jgi:glycosyltransferase involved in cell wall biosynthesis
MQQGGLVVIETHPVQYHAPVFRAVQRMGVPVTAIYGSDFSVAGYRDKEFGTSFAWDTDLLSGYSARFLSRVESGGARIAEETSAKGLTRLLGELAPEAVMVMGYSPAYYRRALVELLRQDIPLLFRAETTDHAVRRSGTKAWLRDSLLTLLYSRCERMLYIGERSLAHYRRLGIAPEKLIFSPYCVDTTPFAFDERARAELRQPMRSQLGLGAGDVAVLFSGKIVTRKGPGTLVAAVKSLPPQVREHMVLLMVGDGELRGELAAEAALEPSIRAHWLGFHNQRALSPFFHAADVLVLPSQTGETWGLVVNEALHHGIPAIVTEAVGCAPDLIVPGATGEVCAAASAPSLRDALARFVDWTRDGVEQRERCRSQVAKYSVENAAAGITSAFNAVVGSGATIEI